MRGVPILIYANKQDLPCALSCAELISRLDLPKIGKGEVAVVVVIVVVGLQLKTTSLILLLNFRSSAYLHFDFV